VAAIVEEVLDSFICCKECSCCIKLEYILSRGEDDRYRTSRKSGDYHAANALV
jgi:hypothetical protein